MRFRHWVWILATGLVLSGTPGPASGITLRRGDLLGGTGGFSFLTHVDGQSGVVSFIPSPSGIGTLASDVGGNVFAELGGVWNRFDPVGETFTPTGFSIVGVDAADLLYADTGGGSIVQIDPATGLPTQIAPSTLLLEPFERVRDFAADGSILRLDFDLAGGTLFIVDPVTGSETLLSSGGLLDNDAVCEPCAPRWLHVNRDGRIFVGVQEFGNVDHIHLIEIDASTGDQTALPNVNLGAYKGVTALLSARDGDPLVCGNLSEPTAGATFRFDLETSEGSLFANTPAAFQPVAYAGPGCSSDAECDDGAFCNGSEVCGAEGLCSPGSDPCPGQLCDEGPSLCVDCLSDGDCDDGLFCTGTEVCNVNGACLAGLDPCPTSVCDESGQACVECLADADCDDGLFCTGTETCDAGNVCQAGNDPCPLPGDTCDDAGDVCVPPAEPVDYDIKSFRASKNVKLGRDITIRLTFTNQGTQPAVALGTVVGVMGGVQVFGQSLQLVDGPGNGASSVTVWYTPSEAGQIVWTATILDNDPDVDAATASTSVSN